MHRWGIDSEDDASSVSSENWSKAALIRDQLEKTLASQGFVNSPRMRQFLRFVVEGSLSGQNDRLKETVIGVEVFNRAPDYDPSIEPVVRVEARRLRSKLQKYYEREGIGDAVVIELPKGSYAPMFEFKSSDPAPVVPRPRRWPWVAAGTVVLGLAALFLVARYRTHTTSAQRVVSIAVLPFANLSGDQGQDYLADGMTEELITRLAKIGSLRVISRTSAMQYKDARKTLPEIAKELNVDAIVEGSCLRSGAQVRITAQLIDGKQDRHLWSEDYDRPVQDILAVQGTVARMIASAIQLTLTRREETQLARDSAIAPGAYDAYLKGRYFWNKRTESGLLKAIDYFKQAVSLSPQSAQPYAGLADSYLLLGEFQMLPREEAFSEARKELDKALDLDHELGEAHASRGALLANQGLWHEAETEYRVALELSPGYATAHQWYAEALAAEGRVGEGLPEIQRALELDPLSLTMNVQMGYILFLARRYDEAIAQLRRAIEMDPSFPNAHGDLGHVYEQKGMYGQAVAELKKAVELTNGPPARLLWLAHAYAMAGQRIEARQIRTTLEEPFRRGEVTAPAMALLDLGLGERDRALTRLKQACSVHQMERITLTPVFDPLRADPTILAALGCTTGQ